MKKTSKWVARYAIVAAAICGWSYRSDMMGTAYMPYTVKSGVDGVYGDPNSARAGRPNVFFSPDSSGQSSNTVEVLTDRSNPFSHKPIEFEGKYAKVALGGCTPAFIKLEDIGVTPDPSNKDIDASALKIPMFKDPYCFSNAAGEVIEGATSNATPLDQSKTKASLGIAFLFGLAVVAVASKITPGSGPGGGPPAAAGRRPASSSASSWARLWATLQW